MFIVLQFPFADARGFIDGGGGRLFLPAWPIASSGKDFVRSSGMVQSRRLGGVDDWPGEDVYGSAENALKFPDLLGNFPIDVNGARASLRCAFRRFHSNGIVARLDVGLKLEWEPDHQTPLDMLSILRQITQIEVRVKGASGTRTPTKLIDANKLLAQHFLKATTNRKQISDDLLQGWWFSAGLPAIIVEYATAASLPTHTVQVMKLPSDGAMLSHASLNIGKQRCSAWFLEKNHGDSDTLRRLRIHLVRLHAERECLKCILLHLHQPERLTITKDSPVSDAIQLYLRDALHLLNKPMRYGIDQTATLAAAQYAFGTAFEGQTASLEQMRRQIAVRVEGYMQRARNTSTIITNIGGTHMNTRIEMGNVNVTGDFNVVTARNIQNSFNKAANADVNPDLKLQLKQLATQVAELAKHLPQENAEQVSRDLETLTSEAVSKKPRRAQYELSGEGLIDAAKTVAEMAAPITAAVKSIMMLLG